MKKWVYPAMAAALYVALTLAIAPLSYHAVQFRFSELLVFLAFVDARYIPGLTLGCFLANLFGPFGLADAIGGSLATLFSVGMIALTAYAWRRKTGGKRGLTAALGVASIWPAVSALIIAFEMVTFCGDDGTYWYWTAMVAAGEIGVVTLCGGPLMRGLYRYHPQLMEQLKIK